VHLVGHSYGALTSLLVARDHPDLVHSLILGEAPVMSMLVITPEGETLFREFLEGAIHPSHAAFQNGEIEEGVRRFINGVLGDSVYHTLPPELHLTMLENAREMKGEVEGISSEMVDFFPNFTCSDAKGITVPVLLMDGENSPKFFGLINNALNRCLPNSEVTVIPGASHDLKFQQPTVFREQVLPFIARN
ncbi:MAG: alpha/beta hydrolase, partial [Balneolaceae bacterium]|nr:alpha/beta hydrolase [Balneolaceae bacterium]